MPRTNLSDKTYIGIDNGVTGTITILRRGSVVFHFPTPVFRELSYTKEKKFINRVNTIALEEQLIHGIGMVNSKKDSSLCSSHFIYTAIERPMVNPTRLTASLSAIRALEATLIVLERLEIPYEYIDSKEWQKALLPKGLKGPELKIAALSVAKRLFPNVETKDADSLIIAEHARRKQL